MRILLQITLLLLVLEIYSQEKITERKNHVDSMVLSMNLNGIRDLDYLADTLTSSFQTDSEKVRAIYIWIAHNIYYDHKKFRQAVNGMGARRPKDMDPDSWEYLQLYNTVSRKRGICGDYARLFAYLCREAKVPCQVISGYAATFPVSILMCLNQQETNHAWNAVMINGKWQLVDVTWASGLMIRRGRKIKRERNDTYYFARPEEFIKDHRPLQARWQLLSQRVSMRKFVRLANQKRKGLI